MREVIVKLGDRRNSGFCLMCGTSLIVPWNDFQCCASCTKKLEAISEKAKRDTTDRSRHMGGCVIQKSNILRQVAPLKKGD